MMPSEEEKVKFEAYWFKCQKALGLHQWVPEFKYKATMSGYASVNAIHNTVTVKIGPSFWKADMDTRRWTVLHELLHLCVDPLRVTYELAMKPWVPEQTWKSIEAVTEEQEELLVDNLGKALCKWLPKYPS